MSGVLEVPSNGEHPCDCGRDYFWYETFLAVLIRAERGSVRVLSMGAPGGSTVWVDLRLQPSGRLS